MLAYDNFDLVQKLAAFGRQMELLPPSIAFGALADDQLSIFQAIDDDHHCRPVDAQHSRQVHLGDPGIAVDKLQDGELPLSQAEFDRAFRKMTMNGILRHPQIEADKVTQYTEIYIAR